MEQTKTFADCTTCLANLRLLPEDHAPISICGKAPESWKGLQFKKLAPKRWFFDQWKKTGDDGFYIARFNEEALSRLDPHRTWQEPRELSHGAPFALVCYEKPGDFCHRHLVSQWLRDAGYEIKEWTP